MVIGESKDLLLALLADETPEIFKAVGAGFERLCTGAIDCGCRVILNQAAQAHNGTQRFGSTQVEGPLSPLSTFLAKNPGSADPVMALADHRRM